MISRASVLLRKDAYGPVGVVKDSQAIYTAASNVLEASKETSSPFLVEGNCKLVALPYA